MSINILSFVVDGNNNVIDSDCDKNDGGCDNIMSVKGTRKEKNKKRKEQ